MSHDLPDATVTALALPPPEPGGVLVLVMDERHVTPDVLDHTHKWVKLVKTIWGSDDHPVLILPRGSDVAVAGRDTTIGDLLDSLEEQSHE